ncbi:MAG TPA: hypothetical protein EYQ00_01100 [Dehalococcoidia bacterium]|nr:hypothetical protein [Dehalococcoidia bacterium]
MLNEREIVTPSLTGAILHGVTRRSLLDLAPQLGYSITERRISIDEVIEGLASGVVTEIFGIGTGAVIAPIGQLSYKDKAIVIKDGNPGPVATRLYTELTQLQRGQIEDTNGWTQVVEI